MLVSRRHDLRCLGLYIWPCPQPVTHASALCISASGNAVPSSSVARCADWMHCTSAVKTEEAPLPTARAVPCACGASGGAHTVDVLRLVVMGRAVHVGCGMGRIRNRRQHQ